MFLSYTAGVILVSLAIYGLWHMIKDIWSFLHGLNKRSPPSSSLVVILRNIENDVEYLIRFLSFEISCINNGSDEEQIDVIIADAGSEDLTLPILTKLAEENDFFTLVILPDAVKSLSEILPFCRGALIHIFDLTGRLKKEEFEAATRSLLNKKNYTF